MPFGLLDYGSAMLVISKERKGSNFAIWQPCYKVNLGMARIKLGATGAAASDCREALFMARAAGSADVAAEAEECVRLAREAAAAAAKAKSKSSASSQSDSG